MFTADWENGTVLPTLHPGASLLVVKEGLQTRLVGQGSLSGNTAAITFANILGNIVGAKVHSILSVLVPDMLRFASPAALMTSPQHGDQLSTLAQLLRDTELWELFSDAAAIAGHTLFAPTNEAFAEVATLGLDVDLASNLQYHSLEGMYTIYALPAYVPVVVGNATQYKMFY
ncbi:fasciclin domain, partial [Haematococcus lacustris]